MPIGPHLFRIVAAALVAGAAVAAHAEPIVPTHDDEVVEVLPATAVARAEARRLRRQLAEQPRDATLAVAAATRYLDQAHASGDPRFAGMAMAAIDGWSDESTMPDAVLMMRATLQQYLHRFDASAASLERLLARPATAPRPQAWLTLATVRRVQARYRESDAACREVVKAGAPLYGEACLAENAALRGETGRARAALSSLMTGQVPAPVEAWLTTTLAELEQRAGRAPEAEAAFQRALRLDPDPYATLAYADLLIEQRRPAEALALLQHETRSDAVLLRLAIAGAQAGVPAAAADAAEMRERIALANERPDAKIFHGREQAMFALAVDRDAARALALVEGEVAVQREPLDLLVLAQAARATGRADAIERVRRLVRKIGLVDARIDAVLAS